MSTGKRRIFDPSLKLEVVRMINYQGQSVQNVSESKKGIGLLCPRNEMIYTVIRQLQKEAIPVQQSCCVLAVSRSGFYEAQRRSAKPVLCKASVHLRAAFMASHLSYGSRRLVTAMASEGFHIGRTRCAA